MSVANRIWESRAVVIDRRAPPPACERAEALGERALRSLRRLERVFELTWAAGAREASVDLVVHLLGDGWITPERERLRSQALDVQRRLIDASREQDDMAAAI